MKAITESLSLLRLALRDGDNVAAGCFDLLGARTERRQIFSAEWSAEMPEKGYHDRPGAPELGERNLVPFATS